MMKPGMPMMGGLAGMNIRPMGFAQMMQGPQGNPMQSQIPRSVPEKFQDRLDKQPMHPMMKGHMQVDPKTFQPMPGGPGMNPKALSQLMNQNDGSPAGSDGPLGSAPPPMGQLTEQELQRMEQMRQRALSGGAVGKLQPMAAGSEKASRLLELLQGGQLSEEEVQQLRQALGSAGEGLGAVSNSEFDEKLRSFPTDISRMGSSGRMRNF